MKTKIMLLVWLTTCSLWAQTNTFVLDLRKHEPIILSFTTNYETISYETNMVSGDNGRGCSACATAEPKNGFYLNIYHPPHPYRDLPYVPATERWWTTNITKVWKLTFEWRGKKEELVRTETVTNVTVRSKLESKWSEPSPGEIERQRDYFNARYGAFTNFYVAEPDIRYGGAVLGNALKGSKPITP